MPTEAFEGRLTCTTDLVARSVGMGQRSTELGTPMITPHPMRWSPGRVSGGKGYTSPGVITARHNPKSVARADSLKRRQQLGRERQILLEINEINRQSLTYYQTMHFLILTHYCLKPFSCQILRFSLG